MLFSIILAFISFSSYASLEFASDFTLSGVNRYYPNGASSLNNIREGFFETNTGIKYSSGNFQMEARALLRSIQSPANKDRTDFAFTDLTPPRRLVKFNTRIGSDHGENQTFLDTGTLWGSYYLDHWQLTLGRKPIGIGVLKVIPVWNRLYPVLPTLSGYMLINNPDILDLRWSNDKWTIASYSIFSQYYDDNISALEFINYGEKLESHFLFSKWWDQAVAGYAGAVDSDLGIFRLESLFVAAGRSDTSAGAQIGLGWERAMTDKLSLLTEYYHSSFGTSNTKKYLYQDYTPFRALLASDYFYPQMIYKFTDLLSTDLGFLINAIDGSMMLINSTTYSFDDNVDLFATVRCPFGGDQQEFGHLEIPVTNQTVEYVRWFSVGLKMTL